MKLKTCAILASLVLVVLVGVSSLSAQAPDSSDVGVAPQESRPATSADLNEPAVEGVLTRAAFNQDYKKPGKEDLKSQLEGVIEGSVTFIVQFPFDKIVENFRKPGTLGKISPNIEHYQILNLEDSPSSPTAVYHIQETLVPLSLPLVGKLGGKDVYVKLTVEKTAIPNGQIVINWELEKGKPSGWAMFSGTANAFDLKDGSSLILVRTHTKSNYHIPDTLRIQLCKHFLNKTKDNIVKWMGGL